MNSRSRSIALAAWIGAASSSVGVRSASADPSPTTIAAAREAFEQGVAASRRADWAAAREAFARSRALLPTPLALLNLATAEAQTGQLVAAAEHYRAFLDAPESAATASFRAGASTALAEIAPRIPRLSLEVRGVRPGDRVTLDHQLLPSAGLHGTFPLDPGAHEIAVARGEQVLLVRRTVLAERAEQSLRLELPAPVRARARPAARGRDVSRLTSPWYRSPWLWGAVALGAAAVATGVAVAVTYDPYPALQGNTTPASGTLR